MRGEILARVEIGRARVLKGDHVIGHDLGPIRSAHVNEDRTIAAVSDLLDLLLGDLGLAGVEDGGHLGDGWG